MKQNKEFNLRWVGKTSFKLQTFSVLLKTSFKLQTFSVLLKTGVKLQTFSALLIPLIKRDLNCHDIRRENVRTQASCFTGANKNISFIKYNIDR